MNDVVRKKLINVVKNEAKSLLDNEELENRLDELDDLYIVRRILENYEELEPTIREFLLNKDKKRKKENNVIEFEK